MTTKATVISKASALKQLGNDDDKVAVKKETVITETYVKDKPANENEANPNSNETINESPAANRPAFNPPIYQTPNAPENRLAEMFSEIRDAEETENETFVAIITRRADNLNDNFRRPCLQNMNFQPLQFTSDYFLSFVSLIQKYNGNSGGRFDIVICDQKGEPLNIGLSNFVIADPIIEEKPATPISDRNDLDTLALVDRIMQQSDQRFAELVKIMRDEKKEDEFTQLAKEKFRNDVLNPQPQTGFNPEKMIENVMGSLAVTTALAEGFGKIINREPAAEKEKGILETLITNDAVIDRAGNVVENLTAAFANMAASRAQPQPPPQYPPQYSNPAGYPPLPQQPPPQQQPEPQQPIVNTVPPEAQQEMENIVNEIIAEIESENPLDETNEKINALKTDKPEIFQMLVMACQIQSFEQLLDRLENLVPDTFDQFYDDKDELNERGAKVEERLQVLYNYFKSIKL